MLIRLQKYLAEAGIASRRACEELIRCGRVSVNGVTVTELGSKVDRYRSLVALDGEKVTIAGEKLYIALHKPTGIITSVKDQFGRKTVLDLLEDGFPRVFPVGRLDYDTSGLIFLTNDGEFTYRLTHPKHSIEKTYLVKLDGSLDDNDIEALEKGLLLEDGMTAPAKLCSVSGDIGFQFVITITEGRNRQVRRMFEAVGRRVDGLHRLSVGGVELGGLGSGEHRPLSLDEVTRLMGV